MAGELVGQNRLAAQIGGWKGQIASAREQRIKSEGIDAESGIKESLYFADQVNEVIAEALVTLVEIISSKRLLSDSESIYSGSDADGRGTE